MKKVRAFDKILNNIKPLIEIEELGIKVYDPEYLSKEANLKIFDLQNEISYYYDLIQQKSTNLAELSTTELNEENLKSRSKITREIQDIYDKINDLSSNYIEVVCKIQPGKLKVLIEELYEENPEYSDFPQHKFILQIQKTINEALTDFRSSELADTVVVSEKKS